MKKLLLLIPLAFLSIPAPIQAQQVNVYQGCIAESYYPAHYDRYGNFVQDSVIRNFVPCGGGGYGYSGGGGYGYSGGGGYGYSNRYRSCAAAPLGAILGGFGAYRATNRVSNRWWSIPLGAVTGGIVGNAVCNY